MATPLIAFCALLALCVGVAQAEPPKLVSYGTFASEGPGVAVDQSSGDVFTAGFFKIEGGEAQGAGGTGLIRQFDGEGNPLSPSPFGPESLYTGAAVNPTNGDLYVLTLSGTIETYDPATGELLSSFPVTPARNFHGFYSIVQIATDSSGDVYEPVTADNEVLEYSQSGEPLNTFKGSGDGALKEPNGVAVDSSGDVWVADTGNNRIEELSPKVGSLRDVPTGAAHLASIFRAR